MCFACIDGEDVRGAVGAYPQAQGAQQEGLGAGPESPGSAPADVRPES